MSHAVSIFMCQIRLDISDHADIIKDNSNKRDGIQLKFDTKLIFKICNMHNM